MKCSPKEWAKFDAEEKKLWTKFNRAFLVPENMPAKLKDYMTTEEREVIAHNLAIQAVWALRNVHVVGVEEAA